MSDYTTMSADEIAIEAIEIAAHAARMAQLADDADDDADDTCEPPLVMAVRTLRRAGTYGPDESYSRLLCECLACISNFMDGVLDLDELVIELTDCVEQSSGFGESDCDAM